MGGTEEKDKHEGEVEKKDKKEKKEKTKDDTEGKEEKSKDEKKKKNKDNDGKEKENKEEGGKEKKKKNPEDNKDPIKLKQKLEKLDTKIQALEAKKEEIMKLLKEAETNPSEAAVA